MQVMNETSAGGKNERFSVESLCISAVQHTARSSDALTFCNVPLDLSRHLKQLALLMHDRHVVHLPVFATSLSLHCAYEITVKYSHNAPHHIYPRPKQVRALVILILTGNRCILDTVTFLYSLSRGVTWVLLWWSKTRQAAAWRFHCDLVSWCRLYWLQQSNHGEKSKIVWGR